MYAYLYLFNTKVAESTPRYNMLFLGYLPTKYIVSKRMRPTKNFGRAQKLDTKYTLWYYFASNVTFVTVTPSASLYKLAEPVVYIAA